MRHRMIFVSVLLLAVVMVGQGREDRAGAAGRFAPTGMWGFCATASDIGCVEQVRIENESGAWDTFVSTERMQEQKIGITMMCTPDMQAMAQFGGQCNPGLVSTVSCVSVSKGICRKESEFPSACVSEAVYLQIAVSASERAGKKFEFVVRTGGFDASLLTGNGMTSYSSTSSPDGTFTLRISGFVDSTLITQMPAGISGDGAREQVEQFLSTASATSAVVGSRITAYPAEKLKYRDPVDLTVCRTMPIQGMWADSNGGQHTSLSLQVPSAGSGLAASMLYLSRGPHYGLPDANGVRGLNPARFKVFVPDSLITASGYTDSASFPDSAVSVKTADGATPTPTRTVATGGLVFDLGITHFSAPDPTIDFRTRSGAATTTTTTTVPLVATTATTAPAAPSGPSLVVAKGKSVSSSKLVSTSGLGRPAGSKVVLKVASAGTRYCRVFGMSVKGLAAGTCRVTVTVTPKKGKAKSKTVTLAIA